MPDNIASKFCTEDSSNLNGCVAIVTGGNSGIGYETTLPLAIRGARVYIAARSPERITKAIVELRLLRQVTLDPRALDMDL
ncbi:hypothetical protein N7G274_004557 [Stereocaulon virgatum]|uniref:Short-chain dehydrogenase n=1 Tax=Stereocaulon virgatum TaxID=373712 RepID=A0ABR4ACK0_9LECA